MPLGLPRQPPSRFTPEEQPEPPPTPRKRARRPPPGAPSEAASSKRGRDPLMKQYLSMLLFDRKNLRFSDFVRLQQLEAQLRALEFDVVGDERHRLELMRQYNAILDTVVHADGPHAARTAREARLGGSLGEGVCESLERLDTSLITERMPTPNASASSSSPVSNSEEEADLLGINEEDAAWSELAMGNWPGAEGEYYVGGEMDDSSAAKGPF
mmetsp:Transcript_28717/g.72835  ORF Transcript_28717/g.72835 Transcript_28717/m.72835 type:complete len:213 (-) Transcript_28717:78-716(-)